MNIMVTVVMPTVAPYVKVNQCRQQGAKVIIWGSNIAESMMHAMKLVTSEGYCYINGYLCPVYSRYNDRDIIIGQGTLGIEIMEDVPNVDAVLVPVGGAGLIAGISSCIKFNNPNVLIYVITAPKLSGDRVSSMSQLPRSIEAWKASLLRA
ncbi:L-threonine dehydratase catabolic TdcB-like [Octopus sinensis]|uniref:L-serine deaminase n=1 Tax=Octopus sinensis TaxID=2607531 RepID=A0A7E6EJ44_9MOLL|nr:L-threonine dehydratase catabolic TdcB-like [Octopus sinensis]XP_036355358.1 L-threonine dehydratase catabolic TdcB-like [Octopus sinensis]